MISTPVRWDSHSKKWSATIDYPELCLGKLHIRTIHLGSYATYEEGLAAAERAGRYYYPGGKPCDPNTLPPRPPIARQNVSRKLMEELFPELREGKEDEENLDPPGDV